jgi:hypothetical protein
MTQIVETRPLPETFPPGRRQDWQDRAVPPILRRGSCSCRSPCFRGAAAHCVY